MLSGDDLAAVRAQAAEWLRIGLSTKRCDRARAEDAVSRVYELTGLTPPRRFEWHDSPRAGALFARSGEAPVADVLRGDVWRSAAAVELKLGKEAAEVVEAAISDATRSALWTQMWRELPGRLYFRARRQRHGPQRLAGRRVAMARCPPSRGLFVGTAPGVVARVGADDSAGRGLRRARMVVADDGNGRAHRTAPDPAEGQVGAVALRRRLRGALLARHPRAILGDRRSDAGTNRRCGQRRGPALRHRVVRVGSIHRRSAADEGRRMPSLWELPTELADIYPEDARILLCTNGAADRTGQLHRFGLVVPGHHDDPVAAAADLYDMPAQACRNLEIRT